MVATRAERVLEAQYQDAVRQRIDDVYGAFVTALAARQTVRYATQSVKGLGNLKELNEQRYQKGVISLGELNAVQNQVPERAARPGRCRGSLPQGQAGSGIAHEPHSPMRSLRSSCGGRSGSGASATACSTTLKKSQRRSVPTSSRSGSAFAGPKPTSGWPEPMPSATCTFSGNPIRSRTIPLTA